MEPLKSSALFIVMILTFQSAYAQLPFRPTLARHLNAVKEKKIEGIIATVADSVTLIFPNGEVIKSKQRFVDFHTNWFKENWKMTTEILSVKESNSLAHALVKYHYTEFDENQSTKSESNTYLLLIFEKGKDGWRLVHDQNTKIIN